jgi:hypothetical protein
MSHSAIASQSPIHELEIEAVAFALVTRAEPHQFEDVRRHLETLAKHHKLIATRLEIGHISIYVVTRTAISVPPAAQLKLHLGSVPPRFNRSDRNLTVSVTSSSVRVRSDWAGSIPCFYSYGARGFVVSNIEPCVAIGTRVGIGDINEEGLYGFLRLSHLIWTETVWNHIFQCPPDSETLFDLSQSPPQTVRLHQVAESDSRSGLSLKRLATELGDLNSELISESLGSADQVVLPLSSGYDSRLILAAASDSRAIRERLVLRTYGPQGSIEVTAARKLARIARAEWSHTTLDFDFLSIPRLLETHRIFGASMHMHAMYQLEFIDVVLRGLGTLKKIILTSGFMTGVPAGQHGMASLLDFSQSRLWTPDLLEQLGLFSQVGRLESGLKERIRSVSDAFQGSELKKNIMTDVWTRQRNFISYYPRALEWALPVASPHMHAKYINFFMSVDDEHLANRAIVESLFKSKYPRFAKVPSNSNNFRLAPRLWRFAFNKARSLKKSSLRGLVPAILRDTPFDFDVTAVRRAGRAAPQMTSGEVNAVLDFAKKQPLSLSLEVGSRPSSGLATFNVLFRWRVACRGSSRCRQCSWKKAHKIQNVS